MGFFGQEWSQQGPFCPITSYITYKWLLPFSSQRSILLSLIFFSCCATNIGIFSKISILCFSPILMRKGWIEHSDQGRKQTSSTGKSNGNICVCLLLLIHDISARSVHFTDIDTDTCGHLVQILLCLGPWILTTTVIIPVQS